MLGSSSQSLMEASSSHPVVLLVPISGWINALILRSPAEPVVHLVLGKIGVIDSGSLMGDARQARSEGDVARNEDEGAGPDEARGMKVKQKFVISRTIKLLGHLWIDTVKPILEALDIQVNHTFVFDLIKAHSIPEVARSLTPSSLLVSHRRASVPAIPCCWPLHRFTYGMRYRLRSIVIYTNTAGTEPGSCFAADTQAWTVESSGCCRERRTWSNSLAQRRPGGQHRQRIGHELCDKRDCPAT
jgi:hypothetical protein